MANRAAPQSPSSENMKNGKIGVGILGTAGWARYGYIAAQQTLDEFEVVAIGSR